MPNAMIPEKHPQELKILFVIPIGSTKAERAFSFIRRIGFVLVW